MHLHAPTQLNKHLYHLHHLSSPLQLTTKNLTTTHLFYFTCTGNAITATGEASFFVIGTFDPGWEWENGAFHIGVYILIFLTAGGLGWVYTHVFGVVV